MNNILDSYIPKFLINVNKGNDDVIFISSSNFSPEGDVYELDERTVSPNVIQTTQSLNELQPEVSTTYPFKIVTPLDVDGVTLLLVPTDAQTVPTASQHYYAPTYFERYRAEFLNKIDKTFNEITNVPEVIETTELEPTLVTTTVVENVAETQSPNTVSTVTTTTTTTQVGEEEPTSEIRSRRDTISNTTTSTITERQTST
jgi:hypothetical protein